MHVPGSESSAKLRECLSQVQKKPEQLAVLEEFGQRAGKA